MYTIRIPTTSSTFDGTNAGPGEIFVYDNHQNYDTHEIFLNNPYYTFSTTASKLSLPSYSNNLYINWCSTNNPLQKNVCTPIKNQGNCGSCWAFAATAVLESAFYLANRNSYLSVPIMAAQQITVCAFTSMGDSSQPCGGGDPFSALGWGARIGMQPDSDYNNNGFLLNPPQLQRCPFDISNKFKYSFPGYCKYKTSSIDEIKSYLVKYGPAVVGVSSLGWSSHGNLIMSNSNTGCRSDNTSMDHAVILVGWDYDTISRQYYWIIRNQWSASWGFSGYGKILMDSSNACGITNFVYFFAPCSLESVQIGDDNNGLDGYKIAGLIVFILILISIACALAYNAINKMKKEEFERTQELTAIDILATTEKSEPSASIENKSVITK